MHVEWIWLSSLQKSVKIIFLLKPEESTISLVIYVETFKHFFFLQVNLCFDQFVYKLADQIFGYYKILAGRYVDPSPPYVQTHSLIRKDLIASSVF